jgi:predicted metal-dependent hydrolase
MNRVEEGVFKIGTARVPYRVTRSSRRHRTISLAIESQAGLTVLAPAETSLRVIEDVTRKRSSWVLRRLEEVRSAAAHMSAREFVSGETILYLGRCYRLRIIETEEPPCCKLVGRWLELAINPQPNKLKRSAAIRSKIIGWYRKRAQERIAEKLLYWSGLYGFEFGRFIVSSPEKRWGSCDSDNNIRINWRVMMVSPPLIDYVLAHELAHVIQKSHSDDFWRLLGSVMPDYDRRREELKRFGEQIVL